MLISIWIFLEIYRDRQYLLSHMMWTSSCCVRWSQEWFLRIVESNIIRRFHQLWDSMHRSCASWPLQCIRFEAYFIYVRLILSLEVWDLLHFWGSKLFADDACIRLGVILEDWLSFLQIQRHEPILVLDGHFRSEIVPWSVFNQVCDTYGDVFHCFGIGGGRGFGSGWPLPSLIHLIQSFKLIQDATVSTLGPAPQLLGLGLSSLEHIVFVLIVVMLHDRFALPWSWLGR